MFLVPRKTNLTDPVLQEARMHVIWDTICNEVRQNNYPSLSATEVIKIRKLVHVIEPQYFKINMKLYNILTYVPENIKNININQKKLMTIGLSKMEKQYIINAYNATEADLNFYTIPISAPVHNVYMPLFMSTAIPIQLPVKSVNNESLFKFERLSFDNRIKYTLYKDSDFASYFYYNTLYAFNLKQDNSREIVVGNVDLPD